MGTGPLLHSSLHPPCPSSLAYAFRRGRALPLGRASLGKRVLRTPRLRREGCWQVPRPGLMLAVIHAPSPPSSSLQGCEVTAIFIPILQMRTPRLSGKPLAQGQRLPLSQCPSWQLRTGLCKQEDSPPKPAPCKRRSPACLLAANGIMRAGPPSSSPLRPSPTLPMSALPGREGASRFLSVEAQSRVYKIPSTHTQISLVSLTWRDTVPDRVSNKCFQWLYCIVKRPVSV